jgi:type VI secretion system secreted protein VgrG
VLCAGVAHADQFTVLGTAATYGVLGASTVTNTGSSVISGNLGLSPGTSITGFPPGTVINGTTYIGPGPAATAQANALTGYTYLAGLAPTETLTGQDLGGQTLTAGVYFFESSAQLTGPLTLNFQGADNADIVFQIGSTLTTASDSTVTVINQGLDDNVYFQVGSSATLGTGTQFEGDIVADTSVTLTTGADITCGSAIALNGAVTMDTNVITNCSTTGSDVTAASSSPTPTPEPGGVLLLGSALAGGVAFLRRRLIPGAVA